MGAVEKKKESVKKSYSRDEVRSHANDPFFVKKNSEAKEAISKIDFSTLEKK